MARKSLSNAKFVPFIYHSQAFGRSWLRRLSAFKQFERLCFSAAWPFCVEYKTKWCVWNWILLNSTPCCLLSERVVVMRETPLGEEHTRRVADSVLTVREKKIKWGVTVDSRVWIHLVRATHTHTHSLHPPPPTPSCRRNPTGFSCFRLIDPLRISKRFYSLSENCSWKCFNFLPRSLF